MFSQQMRQNNNQQQNSLDINQSQLAPIHESIVTKKMLELEYEMQKTQKCYQSVKKPIKYFSKVKRSLPESKNSQHSLQVGVLSQKIIPPNIGQHLTYAQKPHILQNPKLKNVFQVYKQTLEQKYRKKRRLMEKAALKISVGKIHQNQVASEQIIQQKQQLIKKRLSSKRLDPNIINSHQPSPMHRSNLLQSVRQKQCSSRLVETIDDSNSHNFVRSVNKRPDVSIVIPYDHYLSNKQVSIYQVKKKYYSEERENLPVKSNELNKTRNITFKLPNEKRKSNKHFIERLGGQTYNLPEICDKMNDKSDTISYLVKSLRKPSESQHFRASISNPQISIVPKTQQSVQKIAINQRSKRVKTLEPQNESSILQQYDNENLLDCSDRAKNYEYLRAHKNSSRYQIKHHKAKRKLAKYNFMGDIDGWDTQNQLPEIQSHLMHHFVSLEPTQTIFDD